MANPISEQTSYFLQVECVVTEGPDRTIIEEKKRSEAPDIIPNLETVSQRVKDDFNSLLSNQPVRSRCSLGVMLCGLKPSYQRLNNGPFIVELLARILETKEEVSDSGVAEVNLELILATTYDGVGGVRKFAPPQRKMIPGHWHFLGAAGSAESYLSQVARLSVPDSFPTEPDIVGRSSTHQKTNRESGKHFPIVD